MTTPKLISRRISPSNISLLDTVAGIEPGAISLHATDLDAPACERLARHLTEHGELLRILKIRPRQGGHLHADLRAVDFAAHCPNLKTLDVQRVVFNDSVFAHPVLQDLALRQSEYVGPPQIAIRAPHPLRNIEFEDCHVKADVLSIAPESPLKVFRYYLDEDYAEACPDRFEILGTRLEEITVNACWSYTVTTNRASEEHNRRRRTLRAGQYGSVTHIYHKSNGEELVRHYGPENG
ncbi:hypothetical protein [Nonomuraea sp. NPDC050643]|uniref:hypothetical protein n=1 Tax=Nonomuraea sp. NPDC050643 TaxID=3155660 RepID=UPI0033D3277D